MPDREPKPPNEVMPHFFKNWLETELGEAINEFGPEIVSEIKSHQTPRPFLERFLSALIRANSAADTSEKELREKLRVSMKAICGRGPKHRSNKFDDTIPLRWMAEQYQDDHYYKLVYKRRPRSIETLASQAANIFGADPERLRKGFSAHNRELLRDAEPRGAKIQMIQHAALHDLDERLGLFGIMLSPDED